MWVLVISSKVHDFLRNNMVRPQTTDYRLGIPNLVMNVYSVVKSAYG